MNSILKLPPYRCTSIALSSFSDCCSTVTSWPPHFKLQLCNKAILFKNGLPRARLQYIGCTNVEKNCTSSSPAENHATEKHQRGLENSKDTDRRNQAGTGDANLVDFVNGSGRLEELRGGKDLGGANLDKNGRWEVNLGSQTRGFDAGNSICGNGYEEGKAMDSCRELGRSSLGGKGEILGGFIGECKKNEKLSDLSDRNIGNCEKKAILDESSANLVNFSDSVGDECSCAERNEMDGRYENGFDRFKTMDKRNHLGSIILDEINANLVDSSDKVSEKCDSAVGRASTNKTNVSKEQLDSVVIRKAWSPLSSDPIKAKKDKGLLDDEELEKLKILENFVYYHSFDHGHLMVKLMGNEHMGDTKELLTESFAELMWGPLTYRPLLRFTITEHIVERRSFIPHAATLVGLYAEREGEWILGGSVELSFNAKGAAQFPPTPTPPERSPYLCNMAVNKSLRRRGIGWHLLKASEKLVPQMGSDGIYLHCRIIDTAPFNMYARAGYKVVQTDNIFALLTLQRRRHLMYKKLPLPS